MRPNNKTKLGALITLAVLATSSIAALPSATAAPTTFTVNVTTDESDAEYGNGICETPNTGECTLRAAIEEANANVGADTIEFNIPGGDVKRIVPSPELPAITESLTINGYSQPGSAVNTAIAPLPLNNTIMIEIDFSNAGNSDALRLAADDITIRGLALISTDNDFIDTVGVNTVISGNYIGTDASGLSEDLYAGNSNITINGSATGTLVGGLNPQDRNVIVGTQQTVVKATNVEFYGNYFGIAKDGITPLNGDNETPGANINLDAISIGAIIGSPAQGGANVISAHRISQIVAQGSNHVIQGNLLGTDYLGNYRSEYSSGPGVSIAGSGSDILIGGTGEGESNTIVGNGAGISPISFEIPFFGVTLTPSNIASIGNSISNIGVYDYLGFGNSNLGIDLTHGIYDGVPNGPPETFTDTGPNTNDAGDLDTGANGYINTPELRTAVQNDDELTVTYDLDVIGSDSDQYRVEFFASDVPTIFGYGPGETYLGSDVVAPGTDIESLLTIAGDLDVTNEALSATVTPILSTSAHGFGGTSEFSQNIEIGTSTDFDADGISDVEEDAAPNNGDGNDDGTLDSLQATVSSYEVDTTYVTFVTEGCSANGSVSSLAESSLDVTEDGFTYPFGLTDFVLNCSAGDTVNISKHVFTDTEADGFEVHKYRPNTQTFETVQEATVEETVIGGENAILMQYSIEDGGQFDDDGEINGIIVDPVGLAAIYTSSTPAVENPDENTTSATGTLANTGTNLDWQTPVIILELGLLLILLTLLPRKKFQHR
jgi:CSLREA domain-containing protein